MPCHTIARICQEAKGMREMWARDFAVVPLEEVGGGKQV